jgi:hypothetical protein
MAKVINPIRNMAKLKKVQDFLDQCAAWSPDKLDNIQIRCRMIVDNPGTPSELVIELEPDSPEEEAVMSIVDSACMKKREKAVAKLEEYGFEEGPLGVQAKGQTVSRS